LPLAASVDSSSPSAAAAASVTSTVASSTSMLQETRHLSEDDGPNSQVLVLIIFFSSIGSVLFLLALGHACVGGYPRHDRIGPARSRVSPNDHDAADKVFREIDTDKSGTIEPDELAAYLVKIGEVPSKAHTLLMALDTDGDGKISLAEWRKGWQAGTIDKDAKIRANAEFVGVQP
jgi:hypothetical protein